MSRMSLPAATNRRVWLRWLGIFGGTLAWRAAAPGSAAQNPARPRGDDPNAKDDEDQNQRQKAASKLAMEENDKSIKKSVEKLFQLATELKAEVDKTDSVQVLSLVMLRKAEEIEKLAKDIKSRAKG